MDDALLENRSGGTGSGAGENALSRAGKNWIFHRVDEGEVRRVQQEHGLTELAAALALVRAGAEALVDELLSPLLKTHMPDPHELPDAQKAFAWVEQLLSQKKKIAVWGDYDVDGACASALCVRYFREIGHEVIPYVPDRFQEGYGPNQGGLQSLRDRGVSAVIIVDCGTTAFEPLAWAENNGLSTIVIDHHRVGPKLPACEALINPRRTDKESPEALNTLCAAGLVFLFLVGLTRYLRERGYFESMSEPNMVAMLDLVALATVCDMVPLRGLNRAFVKQGLKILHKRQNVGMKALMEVSHVREAPAASDMGYLLGPRINAGGRIGDSSLGVRLLSSEDPQEAIQFARQLHALNQERQRIEHGVNEEAFLQALRHPNSPYLLLMGEYWHEGVLGIVAGHIKDVFHKPAFVLTLKKDFIRGSARSVPGIDVGQLIHSAYDEGLLINGGGHPMAGGLSLERKNFDAFCAFVDQFVKKQRPPEEIPSLYIDRAVTFQTFRDRAFFESLELLEPFGVENAVPRFYLSGIRFENVMAFGFSHLRMKGVQMDGQKYPIVCFRAVGQKIGNWLLSKPSQIVDCVVSVRIDRNFGLYSAQVILEDIRDRGI